MGWGVGRCGHNGRGEEKALYLEAENPDFRIEGQKTRSKAQGVTA